MKQEQNFTQGPIMPALLKFALPVFLALLLQAMYGAVDLQVVGKFGTAADISAVATGSQILHTITVVITGLSMGLTVLLGQKIGEGRAEEAGKAIGSGICLFAVVTLLVTVVMLIAAPQAALLMKAPTDAFAGTVTYVDASGVLLFFTISAVIFQLNNLLISAFASIIFIYKCYLNIDGFRCEEIICVP